MIMIMKIYVLLYYSYIKSMQLFGGFPADIPRASTKNVTYTFPNKVSLP